MDRAALRGRRVLDLSDQKGMLCGMLLGCLGAEVIKVEPPRGDDVRRCGPFFGGIPHPEKSLYWLAYNLNKKGITLNIETTAGQQLLRRLAERADFVIESYPPGYLAELGLDYAKLRPIKPSLIMVSISPFGQEGPYAPHRVSDLVSMAMGGFMFHCGDPEHGPVRLSFPQSHSHAGVHAAVACMIAEFHRLSTGEGQYIDLSMHESVIQVCLMELANWDFGHRIMRRVGPRYQLERVVQREVWRCKDGEVCFRLIGGVYGRRTRPLAEWMAEEGFGERLLNIDWENFDLGGISQAEYDLIEQPLEQFFASKTKNELHSEAVQRGIQLQPCNNAADIVNDEHLRERGYWLKVDYPEWGVSLLHPDPCYGMDVSKDRHYRRAPWLGEHNEEIYCQELGLKTADLSRLKGEGVI